MTLLERSLVFLVGALLTILVCVWIVTSDADVAQMLSFGFSLDTSK